MGACIRSLVDRSADVVARRESSQIVWEIGEKVDTRQEWKYTGLLHHLPLKTCSAIRYRISGSRISERALLDACKNLE